MKAQQPVLAARHISKRFGDVVANDQVDIDIWSGEVHAVLGENGAGKSTLMHVLSGRYTPDSGDVMLGGKRVHFRSPLDALDGGVGMVHQHAMLIPKFSVVENLVLGCEPIRHGLVRLERAADELREVAAEHGIELDPWESVGRLSLAQRQMAELLKLLWRRASVVILDEPTAVLTPQEIDRFLGTIRSMAEAGTAVVLITHKLREVVSVSHRITVMRRGSVVASLVGDDECANETELGRLMIGRAVAPVPALRVATDGEPVLSIENVGAMDDRGHPALKAVSLTVRAGEVVGIAGVDGNGQVELAECIAGLRPLSTGSIEVCGKRLLEGRGYEAGVAYVPPDRKSVGAVMGSSITANVLLKCHIKPQFSRCGVIDRRESRRVTEKLLERFDIRAAGPDALAETLSGGNLQKLILARELQSQPQVVVAAYPTWGLDVAATRFAWNVLLKERERGSAVVLVSADLDEVFTISDRILVVYRGEVVYERRRDEASVDAVGLAMAGVSGTTRL